MPEAPLLIRAFRGEKVERTPVWLMRQAGRYLPEYRALRARYKMLDLIRSSELACEVTMQPIRRFSPDAAIIFADILNPLMGMGVDLDFVEGEGPRISNPVRSKIDVERLIVPDMKESVAYTLQAIMNCVSQLSSSNTPLLGFAGAPFTLSSYLIEGGSLGHLQTVKKFMLEDEASWHLLQEKLCSLICQYLVLQVEAGAAAVQLFDSWAGYLSPEEYSRFVMPHLRRIVSDFRSKCAAPLIYFSTGTAGILHLLPDLGFDGISVDWRMSLQFARNALGSKLPIQGNLDPMILAGPKDYLEVQTRKMLKEGQQIQPYIFNLGHGIIPSTPPENVALVVDLVKNSK